MNDDAEALVALVRDGSAMYYKRRDALASLAKTDPSRARALLLDVLADPEKVLRRQAADLLAAYGDAEVNRALVAALGDADSDVRRNAARSLGKIGAADALEALRRAAQDDESIFVRREAEGAVKALESASAAPAPPPAPASARVSKAEPSPAPEPAPSRLPPWKRAPQEAVPAAARDERPADPETPPLVVGRPGAPQAARPTSPASAEERLPPWKRSGAGAKGGPTGLAASMLPAKPRPPTERIRRVTIRREDSARRTEPPRKPAVIVPLPAGPTHGVEKITRKIRKAVAARATGALLCSKCQWVVKPGQRFCTFCGHPMTPASASAPVASRPAVVIPPPSRPRTQRYPAPPPRRTQADAAPFLKTGCIVAAVAGFVFLFFFMICIGGLSSGSADMDVAPQRVVATAPARPAPAVTERPGIEGPRVEIHLKNGTVVQGNLLAKNEEHVRLLMGTKISRIPADQVERIVYR